MASLEAINATLRESNENQQAGHMLTAETACAVCHKFRQPIVNCILVKVSIVQFINISAFKMQNCVTCPPNNWTLPIVATTVKEMVYRRKQ